MARDKSGELAEIKILLPLDGHNFLQVQAKVCYTLTPSVHWMKKRNSKQNSSTAGDF